MKTIEERADRYVAHYGNSMLSVGAELRSAFIMGARSEYVELTRWHDIPADPKSGFATDDALDEIFRNLPRIVKDKRDGRIELIDHDNAAEWRGDLERTPNRYQWREIHE